MDLNEGLLSAYSEAGREFTSFNVTVTQAGKLEVVVAQSTSDAAVVEAVKADLPDCTIDIQSVSTADGIKTIIFSLSR